MADANANTGYPSIDKPWLKYYRKEPIREFDVEQTTYQLLRLANEANMDNKALNFMGIRGNSWTYRELFDLADKLADAFVRQGVKEGDVVVIATISGLEEPLSFLALNRIGAISKWIDITLSEEEIQEAINAHDCRFAVAFSLIIPKIQNIIDETKLDRILVVEPKQFFRMGRIFTNSLTAIREFSSVVKAGKKESLPVIPSDKRYIAFMDFVKQGTKIHSYKTAEYKKDRPALMIQSSGTTGKPKTIVHTNYTINCSLRKFSTLDLPLNVGEVMLKVAPAWVGYGLINTMMLGLAYGMEVMVTPMLKDDMLITFNEKYDMIFGVPVIYRYLESHLSEIEVMSRPKALISGGDKIERTEVLKFEHDFGEKGCHARVLNGAGNNEILGAGFVNPCKANKPGTVGIPMYGDTVSIFDPDTLEEKKYGEEGEVCIQSEATMLYYENNPEETTKVKKKHPNGSIWVHTNDLGKIDEDGYLYLIGRLSRVIAIDGFKISASQIEEVAYNHQSIKEAVAVAVPDPASFEAPMLFYVLEEGFAGDKESFSDELKQFCQAHLKGRAIPKYYYQLEKMPYTTNNKQDFRKLEEIGKEYVDSITK